MKSSSISYDSTYYIHHPSEIPITVQSHQSLDRSNVRIDDVKIGGLVFGCSRAFAKQAVVDVTIHITQPGFRVIGVVEWCRQVSSDHYEVGIQFHNKEDAFQVRMIEQVCHIEQYKRRVDETEGRSLTTDSAALEWIAKHGAHFPNPGMN